MNPATSAPVIQSAKVEVVRDIDVPTGAWPWIEEIAKEGAPPHQRLETPRDAETIVYWQDEQPAAFVLNLRDQFNRSIQYRVDLRTRLALGEGEKEERFQAGVSKWMEACFGAEISSDKVERNHRFLEESLELVQALGCSAEEAHQLVDYTFGRPTGYAPQEVGGVMVTLAALCLANDMHMDAAGWVELNRIWGKVEQIRAKQAAKPKHSPLPEATPPARPERDDIARVIDPDVMDDNRCNALGIRLVHRQALRDNILTKASQILALIDGAGA